jgi:hypothetical protein
VKASSIHTSVLETVVSSSTSDDSKVNGLSQSQNWPVGFGPGGGGVGAG